MSNLSTPEKKVVPATLFLATTERTTIPQIPHVNGAMLERLHQTVHETGAHIVGDVTFYYHDMTDMVSEFTLGVALPIAELVETAGTVFVREALEFPCMAAEYTGGMPGIGEAWMSLLAEVQSAGLEPAGECREIYKIWVDFDSPDNITELQMGIA